jgi:hypothetical protein
MTNSTVFDCSLMQLPRIYDRSGSITAINNNIEIPFDVQRIYYVYDVPGGEARGGHGHKELKQFIIAASGSFDLILNDGRVKRSFSLSRPYMGVYVPAGIWRELDNFSSGAICLVLSSIIYSEADYIRNYAQFLDYKNIREQK